MAEEAEEGRRIGMKRYCRYKGIACEFTGEYGYCQLTGCVKWHEGWRMWFALCARAKGRTVTHEAD